MIPRDCVAQRASGGLVYYFGVALTTAALFVLVVPFGPWPLRVPFSYEGDGLLLAVLVKAAAEDGPLHFGRLGAPFGVDFVDWGYGGWLIFLVTTPLVALLGHAGTALNAYWLLTVVGAGASAAWAFRRLAIPARVAFVFGVLYALVPGTFYRQVGHIALAHPFVPLLCLLCLRVAGARPESFDRRERWVTLGACVLQGLNLVYYAFFACALLAAAIPMGWLRTRRSALARLGASGILLLTLGSAIPLVPSALYWSRHGRNERLAYKTVADADRYGLKLRHLLLPIEDHPIGAFRTVAARARAARFPDENENVSARLGLLGSVGLLGLLGLAVGRVSGALRGHDADLDAPAALTIGALLLAQVGGLGSIFNLLVVPDVRAYNRISAFMAFFALLATAALVTRASTRLEASARARRGFLRAGLLGLLAFGVMDQVPWTSLYLVRAGSAPRFAEDEAFVRRVERLLPERAMVFQLPHAPLPVSTSLPPPLTPYDPARAYLSSRTLRWSFGSMLGRTDEWHRAVERLPPRAMVHRLALAGFSGIWVDRLAFPRSRHRRAGLETRLTEVAAARPEVSTRQRYYFVSIEGVRRRLEAELGPEAYAAAQAEVLGRVRTDDR